jgi:molybdopterin/thiamine biosynthesis adenylyltransferase/rhodanese-related sulfurtransferase
MIERCAVTSKPKDGSPFPDRGPDRGVAGGAPASGAPGKTPPAPPGAEFPSLSEEETARYGRQLVLPEMTLDGQLRLKRASVLLVGAGGLGSPAALYLCAAGVGRLGIVDDDVVDVTNLQRQVLFGTPDVGRSKLDAAADRLTRLNPNVTFDPHPVRLTRENALGLFSGYDIVIDGSDNFPTRYLVSDACVSLGKPDVYGSIHRMAGQASVFGLDNGPCYRCLYPEPPPPGLVPSCALAGVLGAVPGIIGAIQAVEAIKIIIGRGDTLSGRLLLFDALGMEFREIRFRRDPACPACGPERSSAELPDYEAVCGAPAEEALAVPEITPRELKTCIDAGGDALVLDVREPHEALICRIESALIPLAELPLRLREIDRARDIVVYCRTGIRSAAAAAFLKGAGFERVWNLRGGIRAWAEEIDPTKPKY